MFLISLMKTTPFLSALLLTATCLFSSCQKQTAEQPQPTTSKYDLNFVPAKTNNELRLLRQDPKANLIRTPADFDALLAAGHSPLAKLSTSVQQAFRNDIAFRPGLGVVGLKYDSIQPLLSEDEFAEVLASFGLDIKHGYWGFSTDPKIIKQLSGSTATTNSLDEQLMEDHQGYACESKGNCKQWSTAICLDGC
jgi:hypothetical protein